MPDQRNEPRFSNTSILQVIPISLGWVILNRIVVVSCESQSSLDGVDWGGFKEGGDRKNREIVEARGR
jgi:hypothetical protein